MRCALVKVALAAWLRRLPSFTLRSEVSQSQTGRSTVALRGVAEVLCAVRTAAGELRSVDAVGVVEGEIGHERGACIERLGLGDLQAGEGAANFGVAGLGGSVDACAIRQRRRNCRRGERVVGGGIGVEEDAELKACFGGGELSVFELALALLDCRGEP